MMLWDSRGYMRVETLWLGTVTNVQYPISITLINIVFIVAASPQ
jgi:hypothetical protein